MESLCCMPETNTVLCQLCLNKNKVEKKTMYHEHIPQYAISQQVSLSLNFTSLSSGLHVGGEGHSLSLQSTVSASVQVHLWQLAVHVSPGYKYNPNLDFYSNIRMTANFIKEETNCVLTDFFSPSGP